MVKFSLSLNKIQTGLQDCYLMRAPVLGQARTSCVHLLHSPLNFSSFSKGFTERAFSKRLSLADDPIFSPISSSLMSPPNKTLPKKHLSLDYAPLSQKNDLFSSPEGLALLLYPTVAADTTCTILPQISQFTSQVYTGVTGRKDRISILALWEIPCVEKEFQG